jgi:hypothetical protein
MSHAERCGKGISSKKVVVDEIMLVLQIGGMGWLV